MENYFEYMLSILSNDILIARNQIQEIEARQKLQRTYNLSVETIGYETTEKIMQNIRDFMRKAGF